MARPTKLTAQEATKLQIRPPKGAEIDEVVRCGQDPIYFINKYCKIQHPTRGLLMFKTYPFQDECVRAFREHRYNIIVKSRQLGLSTITAGYATWLAMFRRDKNILVMAQKHRTAKSFVKKVKTMLDSLPPWLRLSAYDANQQEIRFNNGSQIVSIPTTSDAGRSEALSLLIVDEAAIIRNFEEVWTAVFPTLAEGGNAIILSTPNGVGGQYHELWVGAETNGLARDAVGKNGFHPIRLPWDVHPEHDQEWYEKQVAKLGPRKSSQELNCNFQSSGDTFLQASTMDWITTQLRAPIRRDVRHEEMWIYDEPVPDRKYVLGSDVSRGDARDYSTFVVLDMGTGDQVAEYRGKVFPDELASMIVRYGTLYNSALAVIEANTYGNHCLLELRKAAYKNVFYPKAPAHQVENYYPTPKDAPGFSTQTNSRADALARLEDSLRGKIVHPRSQRLYEELQTFVYSDTGAVNVKQKAQAKVGRHDDLVMAMAFACWTYRTYFEEYRLSFVPGQRVASSTRPLFTYAGRVTKVYDSPYRLIDVNSSRTPITVSRPNSLDKRTAQLPPGHDDFSWLLR